MALYKYAQYLHDSENAAFDLIHSPGNITPKSGIYRCAVCGAEIISEVCKPLPLRGHHLHAEELGPIQWRLIVLTQPHGGLEVAVESKSTPSRSPGWKLALELDESSSRETSMPDTNSRPITLSTR
jgi:hypothetical protein